MYIIPSFRTIEITLDIQTHGCMNISYWMNFSSRSCYSSRRISENFPKKKQHWCIYRCLDIFCNRQNRAITLDTAHKKSRSARMQFFEQKKEEKIFHLHPSICISTLSYSGAQIEYFCKTLTLPILPMLSRSPTLMWIYIISSNPLSFPLQEQVVFMSVHCMYSGKRERLHDWIIFSFVKHMFRWWWK